MHRLEELVRLHRLGTPVREVSRLLRMSPRTERRYREALEAAGLLLGRPDELPGVTELKAAVLAARPSASLPAQQVSKIEAWRPTIERLQEKGLRPRAIYDRLRLEDASFPGTYPQVKRLWRAVRLARGVQPEDVAIPVETAPGQVAQVDFGSVGKLWDPETGRIYALVGMTDRASFVDITDVENPVVVGTLAMTEGANGTTSPLHSSRGSTTTSAMPAAASKCQPCTRTDFQSSSSVSASHASKTSGSTRELVKR